MGDFINVPVASPRCSTQYIPAMPFLRACQAVAVDHPGRSARGSLYCAARNKSLGLWGMTILCTTSTPQRQRMESPDV